METGKYDPDFLEYIVDLMEDFQRYLKGFRPADGGPPIADLDKTYNAAMFHSCEDWAEHAFTEMFDLGALQRDYQAFKEGLLDIADISSPQHCQNKILIGGFSHPHLALQLSDCISSRLRSIEAGSAGLRDRRKEIVLDIKGEEIDIHGQKYPLPNTALRLLSVLLAEPGAWYSDKLIAAGRRADKIIERMPPEVATLIERSHKGYRVSRETADRITVLPR